MIGQLPWIIVAVIVYNLIAFLGSPAAFDAAVLDVPTLSNVLWTLRVGDLVIVLAIVMLFAELMKASRNSSVSIADHGLSMLVFVICLVEFLTVRQAATSVFFVILLTALIDVVAGFWISIRFARRDWGVGEGA